MMAIVKKMSVGKQNKPMHKNKNGPKMSISKKKDRINGTGNTASKTAKHAVNSTLETS